MHAQAVLTLTPAASAIRFSLPFALQALSARVHCYNVVAPRVPSALARLAAVAVRQLHLPEPRRRPCPVVSPPVVNRHPPLAPSFVRHSSTHALPFKVSPALVGGGGDASSFTGALSLRFVGELPLAEPFKGHRGGIVAGELVPRRHCSIEAFSVNPCSSSIPAGFPAL
jgi:hypothetical protein